MTNKKVGDIIRNSNPYKNETRLKIIELTDFGAKCIGEGYKNFYKGFQDDCTQELSYKGLKSYPIFK